MDYFRRFTFLFAAPVFEADDLEGLRFNQIVAEIERLDRVSQNPAEGHNG